MPGARPELLRRIFSVTQSVTNPQVQADFRLVPPRPSLPPDIEEFVRDSTGQRNIALLSEGAIARRHAMILEQRVPVLSGMTMPEGVLLLDVPSGARPVATLANSIRRNPQMYGPLFQEIGVIFGGLERAVGKTLEPTPDYPLLRQFAAVADDESESGGKMYLLPPYLFGEANRADTLATLHEELLESRVILSEQASYLVEQVDEGWTN